MADTAFRPIAKPSSRKANRFEAGLANEPSAYETGLAHNYNHQAGLPRDRRQRAYLGRTTGKGARRRKVNPPTPSGSFVAPIPVLTCNGDRGLIVAENIAHSASD